MKNFSTVMVVFDQIQKEDFFRRLEWPYLVRAWSKTIGWEQVSSSSIRLDLAGIDGLESLFIQRRRSGDKIFIMARDSSKRIIQTGIWEWDIHANVALCYRRIYHAPLVELLRDRLSDFCCKTFLMGDV